MENEKTSSHFLTSPVCSHLLPVGPQTGQVQTTFPSHYVLILQSLFLGVQRGCVLEGSLKVMQLILLPSDSNGSLVETTYLILKYSTIPTGHLLQG